MRNMYVERVTGRWVLLAVYLSLTCLLWGSPLSIPSQQHAFCNGNPTQSTSLLFSGQGWAPGHFPLTSLSVTPGQERKRKRGDEKREIRWKDLEPHLLPHIFPPPGSGRREGNWSSAPWQHPFPSQVWGRGSEVQKSGWNYTADMGSGTKLFPGSDCYLGMTSPLGEVFFNVIEVLDALVSDAENFPIS